MVVLLTEITILACQRADYISLKILKQPTDNQLKTTVNVDIFRMYKFSRISENWQFRADLISINDNVLIENTEV